ncbi:MAG: proteasome endopeptidase complex, archaeal, beta subunit [Candidatus Methanomethylicota archaeon]|uniref:Proteasome subunit beta n=1 Tax=Thermoproteota archaeon TaxID=2056631 RepID=A0A497EV95_9CREN|nr:MAG: proteasome endopeptidase complex, archaeal, beta subunit [Candidatus Verstraetearchaeota archaeon]
MFNLSSPDKRNELLQKIHVTGTTTIGVVCKDGVILGADRRVTSGHIIVHKRTRKIYRLDEHLAATIAGVVADAQQIMDIVSINARLYRYYTGSPMKVKSAATLLSNILVDSRSLPYIVQVLVGGVDITGPRLYAIDPFGSLTEEKYVATGSGSPTAIGLLEDLFRPEMSIKEALPIVARAIQAAIKRDPASGGGFDIVIISHDKYEEIPCEKFSFN